MSDELPPYYLDFMRWVATILGADQFERFKQLFTIPVETNEITDSIFSELNKAFHAENKYIDVRFHSEQNRANFITHFESEQKVFTEEAKYALKSGINSIMVCDAPKDGGDPYLYFVDIERVVDIELDSDGNIVWFIYKCDDSHIYLDGDYFWTIYDTIDVQAFHLCKNIPAKFFWDVPVNKRKKLVKASPIQKSLGAFDYYLFFAISKKYLELYASYPFISMLVDDCLYTEAGASCEGGYLLYNVGTENAFTKPCPDCASRHKVGAGLVNLIKAPSKEGDANLLDSIKVIPAETESLDYNNKELERKKEYLIYYNIGKNKSDNKQAQNEMQIMQGFESSASILTFIAENLAKANKWVIDTQAQMMYNEGYVGSTVNYGDQFYQTTSKELSEDYKIAYDSGAAIHELDQIRTELIHAKYKSNPNMIQRAKILKDLEPYPYISIKDLKENNISESVLDLKLNFPKFVSMFEAENGDIVEFGSLTSYKNKIETILKEFKKYQDGEKTN